MVGRGARRCEAVDLLHGGAEGGEVAEPHGLHDLQVGEHRRARLRVAEEGAVGDLAWVRVRVRGRLGRRARSAALAEEKLDDGTELVHGEPEAKRLPRRARGRGMDGRGVGGGGEARGRRWGGAEGEGRRGCLVGGCLALGLRRQRWASVYSSCSALMRPW